MQEYFITVTTGAKPVLRRSPADKRHDVALLLADEERAKWSNRELARRAGVSHEFVARVRERLSGSRCQMEATVQRGDSTYQVKTERIGRTQKKKVAPAEDNHESSKAKTGAAVIWPTPKRARISQPRLILHNRPHCLKCRRAMARRGKVQFKCPACKRTIMAHPKLRVDLQSKASCVGCKGLMVRNGRKLRCRRCSVNLYPRTVGMQMPETGDALLRFVSEMLPAWLPDEIKDEARQAICVDLLARKIKAGELSSQLVVRRYVSAAYGLNSRKFVSIDSPIGDGTRTIGESLAA